MPYGFVLQSRAYLKAAEFILELLTDLLYNLQTCKRDWRT